MLKILIIGKVWPEPASSAAGRRMKQLIKLFQQCGEVHFACANSFTGNEMDLNSIGVKIQHIELNNDSVNVYFREINPDIVIFDRFLTEEQYGWRIIETCPDALRILNTEDLHFLRKTRHKFVKQNNTFTTDTNVLDFQNDDTMRELASIYRSDLTLLVSPFEMELLQNEMNVPAELLAYLPIFTEKKHAEFTSFEEKSDFLFIGNALHEPNSDAISMLKENIWPVIRKQLPKAKLLIAGAYPTQFILQLNNDSAGISVAGHVKDLNKLYKSVRVGLVPLRFGAGIKGKIIESLEYGVPFISTEIGTEGMFFDKNWDDCIANDWDTFAQKTIELYQNKETWNHFQQKGREHLQIHFSESGHEEQFSSLIDKLQKTIHTLRKKRYFSQLVQHHTLMSTRYLSKWIMEKSIKS